MSNTQETKAEAPNNNPLKTDLYQEKPGGNFKKGNPGGGRPPGIRNFTTDFDEAVEEIAKANGITISEARKILFKVAYAEAKGANFPFYKDIMDRYYGKALENVDMTVRTPEPLLDVLHNNSDKKDSSSVEED